MSKTSFYADTAVTNNQTNAIEASKSQAALSAAAASASAGTSSSGAVTATEKAQEAAVSATSASNSNAAATVSKNAAAGSATTALSHSQTASGSANTANQKAQQASSSAGTANTKANEALGSANTSTSSRNLSIAAKNDSVTAKNDAVTAKDASVAARDASVAAKDASIAARDLSVAAKDASVVAKDASVVAKNASVAAKDASAASAAAALTNKNTSVANAATATTKANEASASATASASSATTSTASKNAAVAVTANFLGAHSSAPTQTAAGGSLAVGMLYFDTGSDVLKVRASGGWINAGSSINGTSARFAYTLTANQTTVTGNDANGNPLAYDSGFADVYLNGVKLAAGDFTATSGTSIVLAAGATANDILEVVAFGTFQLSNGSFTGTTTVQNLAVTGTVDGQDVAAMGSKLAGIEVSATADQTKSDIEGLGIDVPAANITGTIAAARLSTAATQAESDDSTKIATTAYVVDKITTLIGGAPSTLDDLNELAQAINDDSSYNSTLTTALATKMPKAGGAFTGGVDITGTLATSSTITVTTAASTKAGSFVGNGIEVKHPTGASNLFIGTQTGNDVKIASIGAQSMRLDTNGTERMHLTAAGNIGINDSSPDGSLHITRSNSSLQLVLERTTGNTAKFSVGLNNGLVFTDLVAGAERMRIDSSGNVGIGTSSIDNKVNIQESALAGRGASNGNTSMTLEHATDTGIQFFSATQTQLRFGDAASTGAGSIVYAHGDDSLRVSTNASEAMRIDSNGNVGIGVSSPSTRLTVLASSANGIDLAQDPDNGANSGRLFFTTSGGTNSIRSTSGSLQFSTGATAGSSSGTERMRIDSNGNVGIGCVPNSIKSGFDTLQIGGNLTLNVDSTGAGAGVYMGNNVYRDSTNSRWEYINTDEASQYLQANGTHVWRYAPSGSANSAISWNEAARLDGNRWYQGTGGPNNPSSSQTGVRISGVNSENFWISANAGTSAYDQFVFCNGTSANGGRVGTITTSGSATAFNTSSDYRLKENVDYDWDATTRLKQLKPARFNFIADADTTVDGFLAHEAQAIVPECVTGIKDAMRDEEYEVTSAVLDESGSVETAAVMGTRSVPDMQGIDQSKLVPLLVKTIQELEARITALEA